MADDLNPEIIKRTQNLLGKYVKKPSLTEKLLKKPPFRFIHDVFCVIIRDTGCFVGLYTATELTFENIKDRDDKLRFLQKMIDVVKLTTNSPLTIRTSKIVAGHEPDKTNELLQLMAEIIDKKLDWKTAVEQILSGKNPSPTKPQEKPNKPHKESKTKDKPKDKDLHTKDLKSTKTSSKTSATNSSNKDDANANKRSTKEKKKTTTTKLTSTTKDKIPKGNAEQDKSIKKSSKEAAKTIAGKLTKHESQSSNKSSPSPSNKESKTIKGPAKIENIDCNHEEVQKIEPTENLTQINMNSLNNEVSLDNDLKNGNQDPIVNTIQKEGEPSSLGKTKTPNPSPAKVRESGGEQPTLAKDNTIVSESEEKSDMKLNHIKKQETFTNSPQKLQQSPPPPPISLANEVKRESTFTRENSKESSSNQSSIGIRPRTSLRPPSARPPSARPGAPRRRDKNIEIILQPNEQIKMSGIQVKLENFGDLDDDGENLVIIDNPNTIDVTSSGAAETLLTESEKMLQDETLEQGHLVQQILETQKDLTQQQNDAGGQQNRDKDSTIGLAMRQTSARHMNNLRDVIQNLTKSVNPLGKLMDFIPEDIDAMQLEFTMWRDAYTQAANELKRERSLTESATEPMKNQLIQIETNLSEYLEMIDASRVKIQQNTEKIIKMLTTS